MKYGVDNLQIHKKIKPISSKNYLISLLILLVNMTLINNNDGIDKVNKGFLDNFVVKFEEGLNSFNKIGNFLDQLKQLNHSLAKESYAIITNDLETFKANIKNIDLRHGIEKNKQLTNLDESSLYEENHNNNANNAEKFEDQLDNSFNIMERNEIYKLSKRTANKETPSDVVIVEHNSSLFQKEEDQFPLFKTMKDIMDYFNNEILSLTSSLEDVLSIDRDNSKKDSLNKKAKNGKKNKKSFLSSESDIFINNTLITFSNIPQEINMNQENFKIKLLRYFNASFYEIHSVSKNRVIIDFSIEGSIAQIFSEEDILNLIASIKNSEEEPKKVYQSKLIILVKNQYLANRLIEINAINFYKIKYSALLISVDLDNEIYRVSDFINENLQSIRRPYFFIDSESFAQMNLIIESSKKAKMDVIVGIDFNNAQEFFPKDYLITMNKLLMIFLIGLLSVWTVMSVIYRKFFNVLHKWFTGLIVVKLFYTFIILCNLDIFFRKSTETDDIMDDFLKIFYETLLVSLNCIFKSFFLFIFYLIFEGFKIFKDQLSRRQTKNFVCIFMMFYVSFCVDQFIDFDVENKIGKFSISEVKNLFIFTIYVIFTQLKAKQSLKFLQKKMIYAKLFVKEYLEQIRIKHEFIRFCKLISPFLILSYMIFTLYFRLTNQIDDNFTKHFVLIHHNLIECFFVAILILPYIPRRLPSNFNEYIFDNLENLENINFYKVHIKRTKTPDNQLASLDESNSTSITNNSSDKAGLFEIKSNPINQSDFNKIYDLKEVKNSNKIQKKALQIKEKEDDMYSIINEIREYTKLKQNFTELGMQNIEFLNRNFPIVILNPGFEDSLCLTEKISLGNII